MFLLSFLSFFQHAIANIPFLIRFLLSGATRPRRVASSRSTSPSLIAQIDHSPSFPFPAPLHPSSLLPFHLHSFKSFQYSSSPCPSRDLFTDYNLVYIIKPLNCNNFCDVRLSTKFCVSTVCLSAVII